MRHLAAYVPKISPGMAVGWYVIPLASLVMPFRAMREVWASDAQRDGILRWWWALYLITSFIGNAILCIAMRDDASVDTLLVKNAASIALDTIAIPLDLVFIAIMRHVTLALDSAVRKPVETPELATVDA